MGHQFMVDMTLGKLARWLRILGFDTVAVREGSDRDLTDRQNRLFLSRNRGLLAKLRGQSHLLLRSHGVAGQMRELFTALQITSTDLPGTPRCSLCNMELIRIERRAVRPFVPDYVACHAARFGRCPQCGRIYWPGTHQRRMGLFMEQVFPHGTSHNADLGSLRCGF
ncbi:MAG: hypothetical protein HYY65_04480 [Candidatus Tectomicrobia bacterium]|uniref:Mut7-C RNAse domain-containing protein n=1 Tax=Tectimicrobiota bacterium TaxID=2528274 RepID=A0A932GNP4_UNCTE|nr:hypothetical protein [Candidatus Tectomicrobia bacterium]